MHPFRTRLLRALDGSEAGYRLAGLLAVLVVLYFVVSSAAFLKTVILPRVGKAINAEITSRTPP